MTVDQNWADGGGCTINLAEKGKGPFQGVTITNNTFGRTTKVRQLRDHRAHDHRADARRRTSSPTALVASVRKGS